MASSSTSFMRLFLRGCQCRSTGGTSLVRVTTSTLKSPCRLSQAMMATAEISTATQTTTDSPFGPVWGLQEWPKESCSSTPSTQWSRQIAPTGTIAQDPKQKE